MATTHVLLQTLRNNAERDLTNSHINNTEEVIALASHTSSQPVTPTKTDPQHFKSKDVQPIDTRGVAHQRHILGPHTLEQREHTKNGEHASTTGSR